MRVKNIVRAVGALALAGFIAVQGEDIKTRVLDGKTEHYTVMVAPGQNPQSVAVKQSKVGVDVTRVVSNQDFKAFEASMTPNEAKRVKTDGSVDYIVLDSEESKRHMWWDTVFATINLRSTTFY